MLVSSTHSLFVSKATEVLKIEPMTRKTFLHARGKQKPSKTDNEKELAEVRVHVDSRKKSVQMTEADEFPTEPASESSTHLEGGILTPITPSSSSSLPHQKPGCGSANEVPIRARRRHSTANRQDKSIETWSKSTRDDDSDHAVAIPGLEQEAKSKESKSQEDGFVHGADLPNVLPDLNKRLEEVPSKRRQRRREHLREIVFDPSTVVDHSLKKNPQRPQYTPVESASTPCLESLFSMLDHQKKRDGVGGTLISLKLEPGSEREV